MYVFHLGLFVELKTRNHSLSVPSHLSICTQLIAELQLTCQRFTLDLPGDNLVPKSQ